MRIKVEFNPDLALRKPNTPGRSKEECLPLRIEENNIYGFLKEGQRNYWLDGEVALLETAGNEKLSKPIASVKIIEATHFKKDGKIFTREKYKIIKAFDINDYKINFEWMKRI